MIFSSYLSLFESKEQFLAEEWLLKSQIFAILLISFHFAIGLLLFAIYRWNEGSYLVATAQLLTSFYLFSGFFIIRRNKKFYAIYSSLFIALFFIYTVIIYFNVPQNRLNILWVVSAPIMLFFFLDKRGGIVMFFLILLFISYLIFNNYRYNTAEFITLLAAFFITSFLMLMYEKVKEREKEHYKRYSQKLEQKVNEKTQELSTLNKILAKKLNEEFDKRLSQEQMLIRQYKMASLGEMIDSIAHQWRQPLMHINAILLNIDSSIQDCKNSSEIEESLEEINSITSHMSKTIDDFRNLFNKEKCKEEFSACELIDEVLSILKSKVKDTKILLECKGDIKLKAYRGELIQSLMIIISNALEALENSKKQEIKIRVQKEQKGVHFIIEDSGGGIDEDLLEKIFEPYFSKKKDKGGSGLGLYIAKIIIEHNLKGKIEAKNSTNGAVFTLYIPNDDNL